MARATWFHHSIPGGVHQTLYTVRGLAVQRLIFALVISEYVAARDLHIVRHRA